RWVLGDGLLNGLLGGGALVAEIDQRREHVLGGLPLHGGLRRRGGKVVELVFEFDHQALGQLFAHAGNARELRVVLAANGLYRALDRKPAQECNSQFWPNARNGNQPLKKPLFLAVQKAEE